jgi:hypothetical protein
METQPDSKHHESKKEKQYVLPRTEDVTKLFNWIRRRYAKAQMDFDPSEDGSFNELGDSQLLRAGLLRLKSSMATSKKPEDIIAMIECAEKRRGPQTNTPAQAPTNGDAARANRRSA